MNEDLHCRLRDYVDDVDDVGRGSGDRRAGRGGVGPLRASEVDELPPYGGKVGRRSSGQVLLEESHRALICFRRKETNNDYSKCISKQGKRIQQQQQQHNCIRSTKNTTTIHP